jgi:hypothetical protein
MGYCYEGRRLCCDSCAVAGGVRKRRCKYNYCPPPALCAPCYASKRAKLREYCDTHCKPASERYAAQRARDQELLAAGHYLRRSAMGRSDGSGLIDVRFRNLAGHEIVLAMPAETYRSRKLSEPSTPADFGLEVPS